MFETYFGKILLTFAISAIPVVELRGGIPFGVAQGLSIKDSVIASIAGNVLPVPFIIVFVRRVFEFLRSRSKRINKLIDALERRGNDKAEVVRKYEFWGLMILVAIPLPGTGAWTGALVAALLDMRLKNAVPAIVIGVVIAALIVSVITYGAVSIIS